MSPANRGGHKDHFVHCLCPLVVTNLVRTIRIFRLWTNIHHNPRVHHDWTKIISPKIKVKLHVNSILVCFYWGMAKYQSHHSVPSNCSFFLFLFPDIFCFYQVIVLKLYTLLQQLTAFFSSDARPTVYLDLVPWTYLQSSRAKSKLVIVLFQSCRMFLLLCHSVL